MGIKGNSDEYLYDRCQRYRWNIKYEFPQRLDEVGITRSARKPRKGPIHEHT